MGTHPLFNKSEVDRIKRAIEEAEKNTSGEIRVHVEPSCKGDPYLRAAYVFYKLNMFKTQRRNAVLVYLAHESRKFAIVGDSGINEMVGPDFWNDVKERMSASFASGDFVGGISLAVLSAGEKLKLYFPYQNDDKNEQSDEISFG